MQLFEHLTSDERYMMEKYITTYATDKIGKYATRENLDYVMRFWDRNKQKLFKMFGENFILEKEVEFEADRDELAERMDDLLDNDGYRFWSECEKIRDKNADYHRVLRELFSSLVDNIYTGETTIIITPDDSEIKIVNGCKCTKALGKIARAFDLNGYEEFRIAHSQILNQKKMKGTLCLSIHPLDYMTMSDNNYDWTSCMSWEDDGCYRRGTVEMMNSEMVVVAYLKGESNMWMPGSDTTWTNKKWRELFIVNDEIISDVKGYPYHNNQLVTLCLDWLKELAGADKYTDNIFEYDINSPCLCPELNCSIRISAYTNAMYKDLYDGQKCYLTKNLYSNEDDEKLKYVTFTYSGESNCMICGECHCFDCEEDLSCCECKSVCCDYCGDNYSRDDMIYIGGACLCPSCYDYQVVTDDLCEEDILKDDSVCIYLAKDKHNIYTVANVNTHYNVVSLLNPILWDYFTAIYKYNGYDHCVFIEDLTDAGRELFGRKLFGIADEGAIDDLAHYSTEYYRNEPALVGKFN